MQDENMTWVLFFLRTVARLWVSDNATGMTPGERLAWVLGPAWRMLVKKRCFERSPYRRRVWRREALVRHRADLDCAALAASNERWKLRGD